MSGRGGYQPPRKPAAVSGPGKLSRRTDGQPAMAPDLDTPGQQYGDRQAQMQAQQQVPLPNGSRSGPAPRRTSSSPPSAGAGRDQQLSDIFTTPSGRPGEPPSAGLDVGPGGGSELLAPPPPNNEREALLQKYADMGNSDAAQLLAQLRQPVAPTPTGPPIMPQPETPFGEQETG